MQRPDFAEAYDALADEYAALNELLRARKAAGMTQADVAERMGIAQASIARLEASAGSRKHAPSVATLRRYADAVGCDLRISLTSRIRAGAFTAASAGKRKPAQPAKRGKAAAKKAAKHAMKAKRAMKAMRGATGKRAPTKRAAAEQATRGMRGAMAKSSRAKKRTAAKRVAMKRRARA